MTSSKFCKVCGKPVKVYPSNRLIGYNEETGAAEYAENEWVTEHNLCAEDCAHGYHDYGFFGLR